MIVRKVNSPAYAEIADLRSEIDAAQIVDGMNHRAETIRNSKGQTILRVRFFSLDAMESFIIENLTSEKHNDSKFATVGHTLLIWDHKQ